MTDGEFCIGIDYGTDSVRALLVDTHDGIELASSVFEYPRWKMGLYCDPVRNIYRQHPLDYIEGLKATIHELLKIDKNCAKRVRAIATDTTGSTPVAVNKAGVPLALLPDFINDPDAMFILWKDHSAIKEADQINLLSRASSVDYTKYSGGVYSSEWFWAKIAHVLRQNDKVAGEAWSWIEHCDWIPALLTGNKDALKIKRSRCAAGHKAMWHADWGGFPPTEFLGKLNPGLRDIRARLPVETYTCDMSAGTLSPEWAAELGLNKDVIVGIGGLDAHFGAVGGEIEPYLLSKVVGTSTCDMMVVPVGNARDRLIKGISGQVEGSIIPGFIGMEAGQSAFGDIYAWFRDLLMWPLKAFPGVPEENIASIKSEIIGELSRQAEMLPSDCNGIVALDWLNGRRTPDANQHLRGAVRGLTLGTDAPRIFRALVEATAFGSRMIAERFVNQGVPVKGVLALGGVAKKSPYIMQTLADVMNMPIRVVRSEHTCALGAAMFAAVTAGLFTSVTEAQEKMGKGFESLYSPIEENVKNYEILFEKYVSFAAYEEGETAHTLQRTKN
ncbi:MAG TPA: ribulokinase [Bacteroidales bacterium]|nr:ribulokinase [Bacteroidales bacterium]